MDSLHRSASGAKSDAASAPPIGCTETPSPAVLARLARGAFDFDILHPGAPPTHSEAALCGGAQVIFSEWLDFGFENVTIFQHPFGWGTSFTYQDGADFSKPGYQFTDLDLRCTIYMLLSGSAALALFRDRDLLAGNPDMIGIACMIQRRAEAVGHDFDAALRDAATVVAKGLKFHRPAIETAAAIIERHGHVTRGTPGVAALLATARATSVMAMPAAGEAACKLAGNFYSARMDLAALAREVSALACEAQS